MKKENALIDELNRIAEKPYVDGEALGRFLMRSYRAVVDKSIKQADMRLFSETEKRLFSSGFYSENENYAAYRGLYYVFYPIMHKAKMLNETLSLSLTELTESIYSKFDETQNRELLLKTPYVFSQEDYSKLAINAIDNIQKDKTKRDEFILASLSYYLREGKEHIPACIDKELRALEKQHFEEDDNPPAVSVYISFLKETGEQITGISDPKYMKALIKKAQEFNLKTLDEYLQFCDMEKKLLYFKGNEAIKDYIKEHTGATLTLNKDSELKKSLSEIINTCSTIVWHTKPKLVELENALGLIPPIEVKKIRGKTSSLFSMDDYLRFYHEDIDTLRKYYPALISAYEGLIDRGNPLETGAYPLFLFCNPQLEPSIIARVKNSGAVISMENREPHNITFNDLSNLQEKIRHSELKPLKDRLNTIYNALTFINCYDIFVDLVCKTFRINNIKDFAKVTIKDYTALSPKYNRALAAVYYSYLESSISPAERREREEKFKEEYSFLRPYEDFLPTSEAIARADNAIKDFYKGKDKNGRFASFETYTLSFLCESVLYKHT